MLKNVEKRLTKVNMPAADAELAVAGLGAKPPRRSHKITLHHLCERLQDRAMTKVESAPGWVVENTIEAPE